MLHVCSYIPILKCIILQCLALLDLRMRFTYKEGARFARSLLVIYIYLLSTHKNHCLISVAPYIYTVTRYVDISQHEEINICL